MANHNTPQFEDLDVQVSIAELPGKPPFWIRGASTLQTCGELYHRCVNDPVMTKGSEQLSDLTISRHFWCGDQFLSHGQSLGSIRRAGESTEISLILRRDLYRIEPARLVAGQTGYTYIDPEEPIGNIIGQIVLHSENSCCYDLYSAKRRRLSGDKGLATYSLWPAGDSANMKDEFTLFIRRRTSPLVYLIMFAAFVSGTAIGHWIWTATLRHA